MAGVKCKMKIVRILLAIISVAFGAMTFAGYFVVILPNGGSPVHDIVLALGFASLFVVGGIMALVNKYTGAWLVVLASLIYMVAGLYNPIRLHGIEGIAYIQSEFFANSAMRCVIAAALVLIMHKRKLANVRAST